MKRCVHLLVCFVFLAAACTSQPPSPPTTVANTPPGTTIPDPTELPKPTPASVTVTETVLDACQEIVEATTSSAGVLKILLKSSEYSPSNSIISEFGFSDFRQPSSSAIWSEDTQKTISFPLPPGALDPKISSDLRWILFRQDITETQSEFWVIGMDGNDAKRIGTVRLTDDIKTKYPGGFFSLDYAWIPNTNTIFYEVDVAYGQIPPLIIDQFVMVDVNSGKAMPIAMPVDTQTFKFAPDGSQMAILTESGLLVVNTQDGQTIFTVQAQLNEPTYSPDGEYIIDFIDGGILLIDAQDGRRQTIPLQYTITSARTEGPGYGPLPDFIWINDTALLLVSLNSDQGYMFSGITPDPEWTFTVWQIDLLHGTTRPIQTFNGDPLSARISPDQKRLAFLNYKREAEIVTRGLQVVELATGEEIASVNGAIFRAWFPDSDNYLYVTGLPYPGNPGTEIKYFLGRVGAEPALVNWGPSAAGWASGKWLDQNRLLMNCRIVAFP